LKIFKKFKKLTLERKFLLIFIVACATLPFAMTENPTELYSRALPLWVSYGWATTWLCDGKPIWQVVLAVYGILTVEILATYFGLHLGQLALRRLTKKIKEALVKGLKLPFSGNTLLLIEKRSGWQGVNSLAKKGRNRLSEKLNKGSLIIIFLFLLIPAPLTDVIAVTALTARKLKYGHWYLVAVNLPHTFLLISFGEMIMNWLKSIF
jgi:hypothetical protein